MIVGASAIVLAPLGVLLAPGALITVAIAANPAMHGMFLAMAQGV